MFDPYPPPRYTTAHHARDPTDMTITVDGLQNMVAQLGGGGDKSAYDTYGTPWVNQAEIDNAYRTSGWFRKIVDILPDDETRAGRSWKADQDQIQAIELEQKRLGLMVKIREARTFARKDGWALLLIGGPGNPASPLAPVSARCVRKRGMSSVGRMSLMVIVRNSSRV